MAGRRQGRWVLAACALLGREIMQRKHGRSRARHPIQGVLLVEIVPFKGRTPAVYGHAKKKEVTRFLWILVMLVGGLVWGGLCSGSACLYSSSRAEAEQFASFSSNGLIECHVCISSSVAKDDQPRRISYVRPAVETLPEQIKRWLDLCLQFATYRFANALEFEGRQYLFISGGRDVLGGQYGVKITDVAILDQAELVVRAEFRRLSEGKECERIFDLVYVKSTGLQARFVASGDEPYIAIETLHGINYLREIVVQSPAIKVFTPAPGKVVGRRFAVEGVARIFEATLFYRVFNRNRCILLCGIVTVNQLASDFVRDSVLPSSALTWNYFSFEIVIPNDADSEQELTMELYSLDEKYGYERDKVVIPLVLMSFGSRGMEERSYGGPAL